MTVIAAKEAHLLIIIFPERWESMCRNILPDLPSKQWSMGHAKPQLRECPCLFRKLLLLAPRHLP